MRLPKMTYDELLNVALHTKSKSERAGAIGIILKDYPKKFEQYLLSVEDDRMNSRDNTSGIRRIAILIDDDIRHSTSYVYPLENILRLCENLR